jgi:hypothetical protein
LLIVVLIAVGFLLWWVFFNARFVCDPPITLMQTHLGDSAAVARCPHVRPSWHRKNGDSAVIYFFHHSSPFLNMHLMSHHHAASAVTPPTITIIITIRC